MNSTNDKYHEAAQQVGAAWDKGMSVEYCARLLQERFAQSAEPPRLAVQEINDALDVAECCVHDQIKNPHEREHVKNGLKKVRDLALAADNARRAMAEQVQEITELRIKLRSANSATQQSGGSSYVVREAIIRQCIERVKAEHLEDPTELADDIAYDHAVNDCAEALESLLNEPVCEGDQS